jgi:hypothetical protein
MTSDFQKRSTFLENPALIFLVLAWVMGVLILSLPVANSFSLLQKVRYLAPAVFISALLMFINLRDGLAFWALGVTALMMGTGYRFRVGSVPTSALEAVLVFLLALLFWNRRPRGALAGADLHLPGQKWLIGFLLFSAAIFVLSLLRGIPLTRAVIQFKGFVLYPLLAYVMVAGIQSRKILYAAIALAVGVALVIAGLGILDFTGSYAPPAHPQAVYRSSGQYGPQNLFGLTLVAIALLLAGWGLGSEKEALRLLVPVVILWLMAGALTSISRTMGVAFTVGAFYLASLRGFNKSYPLVIVGLGVGLLLALFPDAVSGRLFRLSDTSFQGRMDNVSLGIRILRTHPLGTGWGQGWWYNQRMGQLVPSGFIPWHHNDYLNLAVQVGVIGLIVYLVFWGKVILAGRCWLRAHGEHSDLTPVVQGAQAALVALLVGALFEHVLWRPDIAGLVGWVLGIMVGAMRLHERNCESGDG